MPDSKLTRNCIEHEKRISQNEAFIVDIKERLTKISNKLDVVYKNMWLGMGGLGVLTSILNTSAASELLALLSETAYAFFK